MFELDTLVRNKETDRIEWKPYYQNKDIDMIYEAIEICNIEKQVLGDYLDYEILSYRILVDDRVFAFVNDTEKELDFMRKHYDTNEKCRPRYTSDEYDLGYEKIKTKKKGRR